MQKSSSQNCQYVLKLISNVSIRATDGTICIATVTGQEGTCSYKSLQEHGGKFTKIVKISNANQTQFALKTQTHTKMQVQNQK